MEIFKEEDKPDPRTKDGRHRPNSLRCPGCMTHNNELVLSEDGTKIMTDRVYCTLCRESHLVSELKSVG